MATDAELRDALQASRLEVVGRLVESSNNALVVKFQCANEERTAVYKPAAGERPLWDFPDATLARREVAAYLLSEQLGWSLVPLTVWRDDGPGGPGMCQLWVDGGPPAEYIDLFRPGAVPKEWLPILEGRDASGDPVVLAHADSPVLERLVIFDLLANNADRKAGHLIAAAEPHPGRLWAIDHGITFHVEPKLRTVLWGFAERPLPAELREAVQRFVDDSATFSASVRGHISKGEIAAVTARATALLNSAEFPLPDGRGPAVPWPIF